MKLYKGIFFSLAAAAMLTGCSKEDPFSGSADSQTGELMTSCLAPSIANADGIEATRAAVPSTDDFQVTITREGARTPSAEYKYAEMPEILTLPVGNYVVSAHHGDNAAAAWEAPYYYGESKFTIEANQITDEVDPIVAKLSNIRVTIVFHPSLVSSMSPESKVEVKVGDEGTMSFTGSETRSAYFRYVDDSQTLAATFSGTVDGQSVVETKAYDNVAPGNHYRITFRVHSQNEDDPGTINGGVKVDASVEMVDMNVTVPGQEDEILEDDMRPGQNGDTPDPGPGPEDPEKPQAPQINAGTPDAAAIENGQTRVLDISTRNDITDDLCCILNITSDAENGIEAFNVHIASDTLTEDELIGFGLSPDMDLVNPGDLAGPLGGLGFPVNVGGAKSVTFNINKFLPMLNALGVPDGKDFADHDFVITVKDANGTSTVSLMLRTN